MKKSQVYLNKIETESWLGLYELNSEIKWK